MRSNWFIETWRDVRGNAKYEAWRSGVLLLLIPVYHFALRWIGPSASTDRVIMATIALAAVFFVISSAIETLKKSVLMLDVMPTSGPSTTLFLNVRNDGAPAQFSAFCELTGADNDPNPIRRGEFRCAWKDKAEERIFLDTGETGSIWLASFDRSHLLKPDQFIFETTVQAFGIEHWSSQRWWMERDEKVPAFHLRVRIVGSGSKSPRSYEYILRPASLAGPLELVLKAGHSLI